MLSLVALTSIVLSQQAPAPTVMLHLEHSSGIAGVPVAGTVTVEFASGLHGYQNPPSQDYQIPVSVSAAGNHKVTRIKYPIGEPHRVGGETTDSFTYSGAIEIPILVWPMGRPGSTEIGVKVRYQQCTESMCFAPATVTTNAQFEILPAQGDSTRRSVLALKALAGIE